MGDSSKITIPLKVLCVGSAFEAGQRKGNAAMFPRNVLAHTNDFTLRIAAGYTDAEAAIATDMDLDLVFVDADDAEIDLLRDFVEQVRSARPDLPIVLFGRQLAPDLFPVHADMFIRKQSRQVSRLPDEIQESLFRPIDWNSIFEQYTRNEQKPRLEPGLDYADLDSITPEERYIIKQMFKNSEVVQLFQLDTGWSGSRIYTVKPYREHMRILKIESADGLRTVREKFEKLIQPRLDRHIGQLQGPVVEAEHLGGACYMLAGSKREAITLMKFLTNRNEVRREVIDAVLSQLASNLSQLYIGNESVELRFWAPIYSRVLPPELVLSEATILPPDAAIDVPAIDQIKLDSISAIPTYRVLQDIRAHPDTHEVIALKGFEIAEIDTQSGVLYLQDDVTYRRPLSATFQDKDHPILRFKVTLADDVKAELVHPIFRKGRRIDVQGRVVSTQEVTLRRSIEATLGDALLRLGSKFVEVCSEHFVDPLVAARALLWDIGKENIILPLPLLAPATHGDLNTGNILLEVEPHPQVWLIDFADARYGHIYFDLAKLEIEFRTHVLYDLFRDIVVAGVWDEDTALRFMLLLENVLYTHAGEPFNVFLGELRAHHPNWYDQLYQRFLTYFEHMLYFLHNVRSIARSFGTPDQFRAHYPVAVFFQGLAALKFGNLDEPPFGPWSKRLALLAAMVASNHALKNVTTSSVVDELVAGLKEQSAVSVIRSGRGANRRYLLQWNHNWKMYNLIGGKMDAGRDSGLFAKTLQNELWEELQIKIGQDYKIAHEYPTIYLTQFSRRDLVFKDYEFHVFEVELVDDSVLEHTSHLYVTPAEIESLRTTNGEPISETVLNILSRIGQIEAARHTTDQTGLSFRLTPRRASVSDGVAELRGELLSWPTSTVVENVKIHVADSPDLSVVGGPIIYVGRLMPGERRTVTFKVKSGSPHATVAARISFEHPTGASTTFSFSESVDFVEQQTPHFQPVANPYVVGPPIEPVSGSPFYGRDEAIKWIEGGLFDRSRPGVLIVHGQRRTGKTSLMLHLEHLNRTRPASAPPTCFVYVDLQKIDTGIEYFLLELAESAQKALRLRGKAHIHIATDEFRLSPYRTFDRFLDHVEEALGDGRLVFLLDEFELLSNHIAEGVQTERVFSYIRSLVERRTSIAFVLTLASLSRAAPASEGSPLLSLARAYELTYLDRDQATCLIRDPVKQSVQYEDTAVNAIWQMTHGHPYFTQAVCYQLITLINERRRSNFVVDEDIEEAVNHILKEGNLHLNNLWDDLMPEEQIVFATLSDRAEIERRPATLREIQEWCQRGIPEEAIVRALSGLVEHHLIETSPKRLIDAPTEEGFQIAMALMGRWVSRKHPLGALVRKLTVSPVEHKDTVF